MLIRTSSTTVRLSQHLAIIDMASSEPHYFCAFQMLLIAARIDGLQVLGEAYKGKLLMLAFLQNFPNPL